MSKRNRRLIHNINVTPFVDVMLVLLIIFMITSPMLVTGIDIDLPTSSAGPIAAQDNPLVINIDRYGRPHINSSQITHQELPKKLRAITREKYDTKILVRGDSGADYGKVIRVMGLITSAGFSKVMLETEPEA